MDGAILCDEDREAGHITGHMAAHMGLSGMRASPGRGLQQVTKHRARSGQEAFCSSPLISGSYKEKEMEQDDNQHILHPRS